MGILDIIGLSEIKGIDLREHLKTKGFNGSEASFSNVMKRLEKGGMVQSRYSKSVVNGHTVMEKHFKITGAGCYALWNVRQFIESLSWEAAKPPMEPG